MVFPEADVWGLVIPEDDPLAKKKAVSVDNLIGLPLFCSRQSWENDIPRWAGEKMEILHLETKLFLVWKKYQTFSPIAERFLTQIRTTFLLE